jgi:hypothetical protein
MAEQLADLIDLRTVDLTQQLKTQLQFKSLGSIIQQLFH